MLQLLNRENMICLLLSGDSFRLFTSERARMSVEAAPELVEQEYLWSCSLSAASKEFVWKPEVPIDFFFTLIL